MTSTKTVSGWIIWFTGISGSGKTTLSTGLRDRIIQSGHPPPVLLDGDAVRSFFENDLGYSRAERMINVRRIAFAARMLADNGHTVLVANIAPYYEVRDFLRRKLPRYFQIYCKTTLEAVTARDVKNHYKQSTTGTMRQLIGVDDGYDVPRRPDVTIDSSRQTVKESLDHIWTALKERIVI